MLKDRSPLSNSTTKKSRGVRHALLTLLGVEDTHDDAYATRASEKTAERTETNQAGRSDVEGAAMVVSFIHLPVTMGSQLELQLEFTKWIQMVGCTEIHDQMGMVQVIPS